MIQKEKSSLAERIPDAAVKHPRRLPAREAGGMAEAWTQCSAPLLKWNCAPARMPEGQRAVTVFILV